MNDMRMRGNKGGNKFMVCSGIGKGIEILIHNTYIFTLDRNKKKVFQNILLYLIMNIKIKN